jgi:exodeoxyribonuclease VII large subunit
MQLFKERRVLTVSGLTALVRGVLEENFDQVWVEGEISNFACPTSGHCYFTLKDSGAQIRCVMFRSAARTLKFTPRDGMRVLIRGRVTLFEPRGEYQIVADYLEPQGIGGLQLAFIQLKERLAKEGLFSELHKKPIPKLPQRIGIVTSPTGAAIRDILTVLSRRFANVELLISPVRVQGDGSAGEIASAIEDLNRHGNLDVMIVGRGGGSLEDLWAFNEEAVARSIAASSVPVISAVGHETDFTIADFVADLRAPTPSAAAELVAPSIDDDRLAVTELRARLADAAEAKLADERQRLADLRRQLAMRAPLAQIRRARQHLDEIDSALRFRVTTRLAADRRRLESLRRQQALLDPLGTLQRGYAIVRRAADGSLVTSPQQTATDDILEIQLAGGHLPVRAGLPAR